MGLSIRHLATDRDSVNANIFWFDFGGEILGVREHDGSRAVVDINQFPIEMRLQFFLLPLLPVTRQMRRVA